MNSAIYEIFVNKNGKNVHDEFVKFSRGVFSDKYLIEAKKQKDKWNIKTSPEFANFLVKYCLEKIKKEIEVSGVIVSTFDISEKAEFNIERIKQFMGVKQAVVNTKTSPEKIISLMNVYPKAFFALSFNSEEYQLKIKPKAPKSAKPSTTGEKEASADFCSLKTSDKGIISDLFFDNPEFNEAKIKHNIVIKEIILPTNEKDPVKIRENAVRKGKIERIAFYDGKEKKIEADFEA